LTHSYFLAIVTYMTDDECGYRIEDGKIYSDGSWTGTGVCDGNNCFGRNRKLPPENLKGRGRADTMNANGQGYGDAALGELMLIVGGKKQTCMYCLRLTPRG
jgi:hypothetical protein